MNPSSLRVPGDTRPARSTCSPGRRHFIAAACVLAAAGGLGVTSGCSAPLPALRIASNRWPGYEPLYLARSLGLFEEDRIRLIELLSATDCLQALAAGTVEGAALTLDEVFTARAEGLALQVVLVFNFSTGADMILARPDITGLAQLAGRRVGVEQSAVGALMLSSALQAAGLGMDAIERVTLTVDQQRDAFLAGSVDAVVSFDPVATQLLRGGAHKLFDSSAIPDRIVDVLALTPQALARHDGAVEHLLGAHFAALDYLVAQPQDAAARIAPRLALRPEDVLQSYAGLHLPALAENRQLLDGDPPGLLTTAQALAGLMLDSQLLSAPPDMTRLFTGRFLPDTPPA